MHKSIVNCFFGLRFPSCEIMYVIRFVILGHVCDYSVAIAAFVFCRYPAGHRERERERDKS